ncbi:hypothetical protein DFJ58DRAFT_717536 [Suillus subalutaceus]|uniref:uncharacterized protein n=1 Tax=Suillus subalutaceus TaxID=48586 RepID=UPI001B8781B2|nr:uncharacterized protein DFJ58DRAFT_717536 [Suillus subalutaceus]KAG1845100.1 hypothetical protein DFJ58DRAFT_717536 [Suillus subalutaceus]
MKHFSRLFVVVPAFASLVAGFAVPEPGLVVRQQGGGNGNGNGGGGGGGGGGGSGGGNDPQSSSTLDPAVIATGFENDGQDQPTAGQVASLTSSNNFINFCLTVPNEPITNGQQISGGSCNPAPMGSIPSTANMPSAKFTNPTNLDVIPAEPGTGHFTNAEQTYFSAPQQLNGQGQIQGHSHIVIEQLDSLTQTTPTDPTKFSFFKGLNDPANNGILTADVTNGLPEGTYKISTINSAANHQPVLVPIAQHGSLDDVVYFTVSNNANANANGAATGAGGGSVASSAAASGTTTAQSSAASSTNTSDQGNGGNGGNGGGGGGRQGGNGGKGQGGNGGGRGGGGNRRHFLSRNSMH